MEENEILQDNNVINWFPGHMQKTRRLMADNLKLCDILCELRDARIPIMSANPDIEGLAPEKPRIVILNKSDLADDKINKQWQEYFRSKGYFCMLSDSKNKNIAADFERVCRNAAAEMLKRREEKGIINKNIRVMVVGIPNVGKSTFINMVAKRRAADAQDRPGVTKGKQWVRVNGSSNLELLDMPGVLWPKIKSQGQGLMLCYTGAIKDRIHDMELVAMNLLELLNNEHRDLLLARYKMKDTEGMTQYELLEELARARGFVIRGGEKDTERAAEILLDEFRSCKIGRISLEVPPVEE